MTTPCFLYGHNIFIHTGNLISAIHAQAPMSDSATLSLMLPPIDGVDMSVVAAETAHHVCASPQAGCTVSIADAITITVHLAHTLTQHVRTITRAAAALPFVRWVELQPPKALRNAETVAVLHRGGRPPPPAVQRCNPWALMAGGSSWGWQTLAWTWRRAFSETVCARDPVCARDLGTARWLRPAFWATATTAAGTARMWLGR